MTERPYVLLSCAASLDGCIDDTTPTRLLLSNQADLDRVDAVRADADAILVGADTVRRDNPRLLIRSPRRRQERRDAGRPADPVKVTVTTRGSLDPAAAFFSTGESEKLVYCPPETAAHLRREVGGRATVVPVGEPSRFAAILSDLGSRGIRRLMVEGGSRVNTELLTAGLVDELQLAIAPFLLGEPEAPRFVGPGRFPYNQDNPMTLAEVQQLDDAVLLRYLTGSP